MSLNKSKLVISLTLSISLFAMPGFAKNTQSPQEKSSKNHTISLKNIRIVMTAKLTKAKKRWGVETTLPDDSVSEPTIIEKGNNAWIADMAVIQVSNGRWLLDIDGDVMCMTSPVSPAIGSRSLGMPPNSNAQ
ncbi:hypothetical protein [Dickeya chrysanthemi]|uniref:hypothetical protein n=1 Tax=Dickeya chrysanthemi TaxID=556 RepID=UPI00047F7B65|nr:hypothetical protein [Dickeya chrysanthemi]